MAAQIGVASGSKNGLQSMLDAQNAGYVIQNQVLEISIDVTTSQYCAMAINVTPVNSSSCTLLLHCGRWNVTTVSKALCLGNSKSVAELKYAYSDGTFKIYVKPTEAYSKAGFNMISRYISEGAISSQIVDSIPEGTVALSVVSI